MSSCHSLENASTLSGVSFVSNYIFILAGANFRPSMPIFGVYAIIFRHSDIFFLFQGKNSVNAIIYGFVMSMCGMNMTSLYRSS